MNKLMIFERAAAPRDNVLPLLSSSPPSYLWRRLEKHREIRVFVNDLSDDDVLAARAGQQTAATTLNGSSQ